MRNHKQKIIVICGPTASGKTGLALQLAKELKNANILSADSRQVYQDLDLITGKDIPKNLPPEIKVFGHDIFTPNERANLADFVRYSQAIIKESRVSNTPLIIVGGTGLYLKALTQNLSDISIPPNPLLRQELEKLSVEKLQELLQKENPQKLSSLNRSDFMNPRRLIRYLEISRSKASSSDINISTKDISFYWVGLLPDKDTLKTSIHHRVLERIKGGAVAEVRALLKKYPDRSLAIYTSLGVPQIIAFLEGKLSEKQLVEVWANAETDYSRRQIVWFKKQPGIVWYDKSTDRSLLVSQLKKIYQQNA
ncbi:MAG: tRNA (adenosine(37)-N6)-dimethylallyltransferase MiaA [Microgenomates group bacterium]